MAVDGGRVALDTMEFARHAGHPFSLVLLDCHMPEMDGFAVAKQIRDKPELSSTTLMLLTSGGSPGDGARCRELGFLHISTSQSARLNSCKGSAGFTRRCHRRRFH
jgi:CheY-like chemotaxis protein